VSDLQVNSRLRFSVNIHVKALLIDIVASHRCVIVVHSRDFDPVRRVGADTVMQLNDELRDVLVLLVEADRDVAVWSSRLNVMCLVVP